MINRKVLAACLARTNMGLPEPTVEEIATALHSRNNSIEDAVIIVCGDVLEKESDTQAFVDEAESFLEMMKDMNDKGLIDTWSARKAMVAHCDQDLNLD